MKSFSKNQDRIKATNPPIEINPLSNCYVPNPNRINSEIEEIP